MRNQIMASVKPSRNMVLLVVLALSCASVEALNRRVPSDIRKVFWQVTGLASSPDGHEPVTSSQALDYFVLVASLLGMLYISCALAVLCDHFFMPCLVCIQKRLRLSDSVAGATFVSVATCAPEISTNAIAVARGGQKMFDLGLGNVVGSGVFILSLCLGIASLFAYTPVKLRTGAVLRDSLFYLLSIAVLTVFILDKTIVWWESLILTLLYAFYLLLLYFLEPRSPIDNGPSQPTETQGLLAPAYTSLAEHYTSLQSRKPLPPPVKKSCGAKAWRIFLSPLKFIFSYLVPSKGLDLSGQWYHHALAFVLMVCYIAGLSRVMMLLIDQVVAPVLGIGHLLAGLTVVAWGSNVPATVNAAIAVRHQSGDMAVSSAIGAQILTVSLGLGLPWLIYNAFAGAIAFSYVGIVWSLCFLAGILVAFVLVVSANRMRLTRAIGVVFMLFYVGFVVFEWVVKPRL